MSAKKTLTSNQRKSLILKGFSEIPALGVILSRDARFGQGVEQGGFANVGQTHDAAFQTHKNILVTAVDCTKPTNSETQLSLCAETHRRLATNSLAYGLK